MASKTWDPTRWEEEISQYETKDGKNHPPKGAILFTGSSTIRMWKTLAKDMAPLTAINRGFGGSRIPDATYFFDRIIAPYEPKGIVIYSGENDIAGPPRSEAAPSKAVKEDFKAFCAKIHAHFPDIPIYFMSIKPPKRRIAHQEEMYRANQLIRDLCEENPNLFFIDIVPILSCEGTGQIKEKISKADGIHLNKKGYKLITSVIRPILLEHFG